MAWEPMQWAVLQGLGTGLRHVLHGVPHGQRRRGLAGPGYFAGEFLAGGCGLRVVQELLHQGPSGGLGGDSLLLVTQLLHEPRLLLGLGRQAWSFVGPSGGLRGFGVMLLITGGQVLDMCWRWLVVVDHGVGPLVETLVVDMS